MCHGLRHLLTPSGGTIDEAPAASVSAWPLVWAAKNFTGWCWVVPVRKISQKVTAPPGFEGAASYSDVMKKAVELLPPGRLRAPGAGHFPARFFADQFSNDPTRCLRCGAPGRLVPDRPRSQRHRRRRRLDCLTRRVRGLEMVLTAPRSRGSDQVLIRP